jgi:hypothetical protein
MLFHLKTVPRCSERHIVEPRNLIHRKDAVINPNFVDKPMVRENSTKIANEKFISCITLPAATTILQGMTYFPWNNFEASQQDSIIAITA